MIPSPPDPPSPSAEARLVAISGPLSGEVLPLLERGVRIGRETSNDICLSDLALSRVHCTIDTVDGKWRIRDSQSSNGTFVNGKQIKEQELASGDQLQLGRTLLLYTGVTEGRVEDLADKIKFVSQHDDSDGSRIVHSMH